MNDGNYIKLYRSFLDWEWYGNINTCRLFFHCLLKANWKEGKFEGKIVERGAFITSLPQLSTELQLTENEIRTAIKHLKSTGEITDKTYNKYRIITVKNYDKYQNENRQLTDKSQAVNRQSTGNAQSINRLLTAIEEKKEIKNINKNTMCSADANALFESLWKLYPEKKGKGKVSDTAKRRLFKIGFDEMSRSIDRYKTELDKDKDWRKPQNGSTFFNSGYVDYLDKNYVPGSTKKPRGPTAQFNQFMQNDYDFEALEKEILSN